MFRYVSQSAARNRNGKCKIGVEGVGLIKGGCRLQQ